jgi:hypothetical protein
MGRYDKWFINENSQIQHRHCDNPESYRSKADHEEHIKQLDEKIGRKNVY